MMARDALVTAAQAHVVWKKQKAALRMAAIRNGSVGLDVLAGFNELASA